MAIDSETKRRSIFEIPAIGIDPVADGTISALDREHVTNLYGGIVVITVSQAAMRLFRAKKGISLIAIKESIFRGIKKGKHKVQ